MKTRLLITVNDASILTKSRSSLLWFVEIFKSSKINVWIDNKEGEPIVLSARKKPYELFVSPGQHVVYFDDPKRSTRAKLTNLAIKTELGAFAFGANLGSGGSILGSLFSADVLTGGRQSEVRDNMLVCNLSEGDELAVSVKPLNKKVKIKIEN